MYSHMLGAAVVRHINAQYHKWMMPGLMFGGGGLCVQWCIVLIFRNVEGPDSSPGWVIFPRLLLLSLTLSPCYSLPFLINEGTKAPTNKK